MSGGEAPPQPGQVSVRQAVGWGVAFLVLIVLIVLFFLLGRQVRPMLGVLPHEVWPSSLS